MPALSNPKHERFAQALAKGASASEAYVAAGYTRNDGNAARLKGNEKVSARVGELLTNAATRTEVTVASITERLLRLADVAEKTGVSLDDKTKEVAGSSPKHLSVARAALMDIAKLNGLIVEPGGGDDANLTVTIKGGLPDAGD